jgi:hypothetical protein
MTNIAAARMDFMHLHVGKKCCWKKQKQQQHQKAKAAAVESIHIAEGLQILLDEMILLPVSGPREWQQEPDAQLQDRANWSGEKTNLLERCWW